MPVDNDFNPEDGMSQAAKDSDQMALSQLYPVDKIYADPNFNCRGHISPMSVIDLAKSIAQDGLLQPITIRPRQDGDPAGYDYVIIAGHRRHKAYIVNGAKMIPAILKTGLTEFKMRTLNAVENLKRQDLNMLQEARTVEHFKNAGYSREDVAAEIGMSPGWVQVRFMLLDLPTEIQEAAAHGFFTTVHIRDLYSIKDPEEMFKAAKAIRQAKLKGEKVAANAVVKKKRAPNTRRVRKPAELNELLKEIQNTIGNSFVTRVLAWGVGVVSDFEIYSDLQKLCADKNIKYKIPDFINQLQLEVCENPSNTLDVPNSDGRI